MEILTTQRMPQSVVTDTSERAAMERSEARAADVAEPTKVSPEVPRLSYRRSERMSLVAETQEGDRVRVTFRTHESQRPTEAGGDEVDPSRAMVTVRSSSKISIEIHGDLNSAELTAIQDAFDRATELADEFFAGGVQDAFEGAAALDIDTEQLVRVGLRGSVRQMVTYSHLSFFSAPVPTEGASDTTTDGDLTGVERIDVPAPILIDSTSPGEPRATIVGAKPEMAESVPEAELSSEAEPQVEAMEPEIATAVEPIEDAQDPQRVIADFLSRVAERFGSHGTELNSGVLDFSLKIRMFESTLMALSQAESGEEPGLPSLVPEILEAMAAKQHPLAEVA